MGITKKSLAIIGVLLILFIIYLYNILPLVIGWGPSSNYENVSVRTTVNVTDAYPEIINVTCDSQSSITLNAGTTKKVNCTVEIRDFDGGNTINSTNATFYYYLNKSNDPDDNNTHYTNATCTEEAVSGTFANWSCVFDILYYANNGTWIMNTTVMDDYNFTDNDTTNVTIEALYALNVTTPIDFGNMAVGDTTGTQKQANVTNFGNLEINITVYGFGGEDPVAGSGLAMICEIRNISIDNERYAPNSSAAYADMIKITGAAANIPYFQIPQQTNETSKEINTTYWRLHVNATTNPNGICNGTVIFEAVAP